MAMLHRAFPDLHVEVAETWGVVDVFAQMRQLGMIPA
jgi:hypothetical protein